ncbi:hypothetical protein [Herminiimonas contaminans]|uniref:Uncharacterized protein n=1 Tax=Herminiimonas contaminans TaxID=1111140 RepID=A0ABS0EYM3_9BURK|nr:hypothetical protein [Herminiimonas contaminans]MBF8178393.1 hypothetical protein [Herminiimonas contaminans]
MNEGSKQVAELFRTLARHCELLAEAFNGSVDGDDRKRANAIDALVTVKALKPYEDGVYELNPRLREFVADHLVTYQAYQRLTRVSATIKQARLQWREIRDLRVTGDYADVEKLERAFNDSVSDIAYAVERNLELLHSLVNTQYGNVNNFASKLRQNVFYSNEVASLLREMEQVEQVFTQVADEALHEGTLNVRQLVNRRLLVRLLDWTQRIKSAQEVITRRLFLSRQLEDRLRQLATTSLWLRQNKTASGFEIDVKDTAPAVLFKSEAIAVKRQIDVLDSDSLMQDALRDAVARIPPREVFSLTEEVDLERITARTDVDDQVVEELLPHERAIEVLVEELMQPGAGISLVEWKTKGSDADELSMEEWLLFSSIQLQSEGFCIKYLEDEAESRMTLNRQFHDVVVSRA